MTLVKICGLSQIDHAVAASAAGADFLGMVFAESRRQVTPERALRIVKALKRLKSRAKTVGVFAGQSPEDVNRIAEYSGLDRIQLSGGESWDYCLKIERPIIKSFHISPGTTAEEVIAAIERGTKVLEQHDVILMLDTKVGNTSGGTGMTFDWSVAKRVGSRFQVMVAGGLNPDNIARLIEEVRPWAVDVSSGLETAGKKDKAKIVAFADAVRRFDSRTGGAE